MAKIENDLKSSSLPTNVEDKEINELTYSYFQLFRYSTLWEKVLILAGIGCAVISASGVVIINIMYGEITTLFIDRTVRNGTSKRIYILNLFGGGKYLANATDQEYKDALIDDAASYGLANLANFVIYFATAALSVQLMNWTAVRQITRIRLLFLKSVIRQDMSWFDTETNLNFASRVTDDMEKLKEGISEKVAIFVNMSGAVVICCCTALGIGWELALVGLTVVAASIGAAAVVLRVQAKSTVKELKAYSHAGRVVEEVLSGVRTVVAFNGEEKEIERYAKRLSPAEECARRRGAISSAGDGIKWFLTYILNAIIFYYGTQLIIRDGALPEDERIYNPGNMITILFCLFFSAQNIALCSTHTDTFSVAKGAAKTIFELLDRRSEIDCLSHEGAKPRSLVGAISLENVFFNYPARPDVKVLQGLTLTITPGETVALVGPSGCGKSTILQLIQRLYDPASGSVSIDEQAVKNLNLGWLRTRLGVVGQEPVLFSGTIRDNIALGKDNATFEEIKEAAKKASAHDFIHHMADGYCTVIGERGAQLSGGQKQRIAIARSLIRNPKILLLDEATSALDLRSERKVQAALDKASEGRTTLVVSHRLSTVVNATRIVYIDNGIVAEQGTHQELLNKRGLYWKLVQTDRENHPEYGLQAALKEEDGVDEDADEDLVLKTARAKDNGLTEVPSAFLSQRLIHRKSSTFSMKSVTKILTSHAVNENSKLNDTEDVESSTWSLLKLNAKEWPYILVGCVASCLVGCTQPLFAILFSELNEMFSYGNNEDILAASKLYSGLFALVAAMSGVTTFVQAHLFTVAGLKMTTRLRIQTFRSYLKQEMGWFDNPRNSVGALCARLSTDAAAIQGATGMRVGIVLQCVATMLIGIVLAMIYSWKVTLVSIVIIPLVIITMFLEGYITRESHLTERKAMEDASQIATEAIMNIRTIQSLGIAPKVIERYMAALEQASKAGNMKTRLRGCVYAMGLTSTPMAYALVFYYGGVLIATEDMPYKTPILVSMLLLYGAYTMGQVLCLAPNFNSAKISGSRIIRLMERQPRITSAQGLKDTGRWTAKGDISYSNVEFRYPTRPGIQVLQGLDLELEAGKTLALVGHSGCGKSTCIQLLQRLYDMDGGHVTIDAKNIMNDLTLPRLRSQLGIVQQEPVLFDKTIAENIKYGDNSRTVQMEEVQAASIAANVHGFITALPMGYETTVGSMGTQLSGGQKQRVAIARALVRNPRILLLDEATSALDTQSEKLVQQALDVAKESRTCIIIAHRLATVHNADKICVLDKGKVAEHGTHAELMQLGGLYYELNQIQSNTN